LNWRADRCEGRGDLPPRSGAKLQKHLRGSYAAKGAEVTSKSIDRRRHRELTEKWPSGAHALAGRRASVENTGRAFPSMWHLAVGTRRPGDGATRVGSLGMNRCAQKYALLERESACEPGVLAVLRWARFRAEPKKNTSRAIFLKSWGTRQDRAPKGAGVANFFLQRKRRLREHSAVHLLRTRTKIKT